MWDYSAAVEPYPYGEETSYILGMELLTDCEVVEDWGCGTAWAKRYCPGAYVGVDQAPGFADVVADLRTYQSFTEGVFMRHVLEHNEDWRDILDNAVSSATKALVVILFTPMADETHTRVVAQGVPDISFSAQELEQRFGDHPVYSRDLASATQYGMERIYHVDMTRAKAAPLWTSR